jgi:hypothetical protein
MLDGFDIRVSCDALPEIPEMFQRAGRDSLAIEGRVEP